MVGFSQQAGIGINPRFLACQIKVLLIHPVPQEFFKCRSYQHRGSRGVYAGVLQEVIRLRKIQNLPQFFGRGLWQGDLAEMREDKIAGRRFLGRSPRGRS